MKYQNEITFCVKGKYALFTDPVTRIGGEKSTMLLPTYQAMKGIAESIYWKPSIIWKIDELRVMNPIRTESKGIRPISYSGRNDLSIYNYLRDVEYQVKMHFEFNEFRPDLKNDWNENKHYFIAKRCLERGGRRDIFLGTRECQGYVEPVTFGAFKGYYDKEEELGFGLCYHSIRYPDETGTQEMSVTFWNAVMRYGMVKYPKPQECLVQKVIRKAKPKIFSQCQFSGWREEGLLEGYSLEKDELVKEVGE